MAKKSSPWISQPCKGLFQTKRALLFWAWPCSLNFLGFSTPGSFNFLLSISFYIPQKDIQPLIIVYKEFLYSAGTVIGSRSIPNQPNHPEISLITIPTIAIPGWWFQHDFYFPFHIWDVILPVDELHHFSRWWNCTTNHSYSVSMSTKGQTLALVLTCKGCCLRWVMEEFSGDLSTTCVATQGLGCSILACSFK